MRVALEEQHSPQAQAATAPGPSGRPFAENRFGTTRRMRPSPCPSLSGMVVLRRHATCMIVLSAVLCQSIRHAMRKMFPEICVLHMLRKLRWFRWRLNLRRETEKASLHNAWRARDVRVDCVQRKPRMKDIHTTCQAEPCTESQQFPVAHRFSGTVRRFSKLWNPGFSVNLLYRLLVVSLESRTVEIVERPHSRVNTCSPRQLCDPGSDKTFYRPEGSGLGQLSAS